MVFDPDNYNFRLDAGNIYAVFVSITGAAGANAVLQLVNPAASVVNARILSIQDQSNAGTTAVGFDTVNQAGVAATVRNLKSGGAAGVVTANTKTSAVAPATSVQIYSLAGAGIGNIANPQYGVPLPLLEITPGNFADIWQTSAATGLTTTVIWLEVPTGVV